MTAKRIDHTDATIPKPDSKLLAAMAEQGYAAFSEGNYKAKLWMNLDPNEQDTWLVAARAMYGVVAIGGGAEVEEVS